MSHRSNSSNPSSPEGHGSHHEAPRPRVEFTEHEILARPAASSEIDSTSKAIEARPKILLLQHALLFDGNGDPPLEEQDVEIRNQTISAIGSHLPVAKDAMVIDLRGHSLLPGFIDSHVHMTGAPAKDYATGVVRRISQNQADQALLGAKNARDTLMAGFTTVRETGGSFASRALRDAISKGWIDGPRMLVANYAIGITGGHCDRTNGHHPDLFGGSPGIEQGIADGVDEVRKAVRYQIKHGADLIKICATGGVLSRGDGAEAPQLTEAEMQAIVDEATRAGRKVAAHAHGNEGIRSAVKAGVASIEHGSVLDAPTIRLMKQNKTILVPTTYVGLWVEDLARSGKLSQDSVAKALETGPLIRKSFKLAYDSGVTIALGSDAGVFHHGSNAKEFSTMVELGMNPMDAIVAGTKNAAQLLGISNIGQIKVGYLADIIAVEGNPLRNVQLLEQPVLIIKDGAIYKRPE